MTCHTALRLTAGIDRKVLDRATRSVLPRLRMLNDDGTVTLGPVIRGDPRHLAGVYAPFIRRKYKELRDGHRD